MANKDRHPLTPRQKRLQLSIWAAVLGGAAIGFAVGWFENDGGTDKGPSIATFFGNSLDPSFAVITAIVSLLVIGASTYFYHKNADEHEERAILWGSTIGSYATVTLGFIWVILHKGALLPEPSIMGLLGILCLFSLAPYLWLKYR